MKNIEFGHLIIGFDGEKNIVTSYVNGKENVIRSRILFIHNILRSVSECALLRLSSK